jgi:hypothetical protein
LIFHIKKSRKTCHPSTHFLAGETAAMFSRYPVRCLSACHRQSVGRHPDTDGGSSSVSAFILVLLPLLPYNGMCNHFRLTGGESMDDYQKLAAEISESVIKQVQRRSIKKYLIDNWIAILALIVAIIALFK